MLQISIHDDDIASLRSQNPFDCSACEATTPNSADATNSTIVLTEGSYNLAGSVG